MSNEKAKLDTSLRQIYGNELNLVFERFQEDPPTNVLFRGQPVGKKPLISFLSGNYGDSSSHTYDKRIAIINEDEGQIKFGISFFGTTPAAPNGHFVYITVIGKVFHVDSDYGIDIEGVSGVVEMPMGSSYDDLMANVAPVTTAKAYLRGNLSPRRYGEYSAIYNDRSRVYTGIELVHKLVHVAEDNLAEIQAAMASDCPSVNIRTLEEAIWDANVNRYGPLEPIFINDVTTIDYFKEIVEDLESLILLERDKSQWTERWYLSLQHAGYEAMEMLRARLAFVEGHLQKSTILNNKAFAKHEKALRDTLEKSKVQIVASLQNEILKKAKDDINDPANATTMPSPQENVPAVIRKSSAGEKLSRFDLEVMLKSGDRVFLKVEKPGEPAIEIGATIDTLDTTYIDFDGDDGNNYTVFWHDWDKKEEIAIVRMTTEEDYQIRTTIYAIVDED